MPIDRIAFALAVTERLSQEVAVRLNDAWETFAPEPQPDETDAAAGRALALALSSLPITTAAEQIDGLTLYAAELQPGPASLTLEPSDAYGHPLLSDWVSGTFGDALGAAIRAGRIAGNIGGNAPVFLSYELCEEGGRLHAANAHMLFEGPRGSVQVVLRYGAQPAAPMARINVITGDVAYAIGANLRGGLPAIIANAGGAGLADDAAAGSIH